MPDSPSTPKFHQEERVNSHHLEVITYPKLYKLRYIQECMLIEENSGNNQTLNYFLDTYRVQISPLLNHVGLEGLVMLSPTLWAN